MPRRGPCCRGACSSGSTAPVTAAEAKQFLDTANATLLRLGVAQGRAGWVQQTYITDDTEAIAARANQEYLDAAARLAKEATKFDRVDVPPAERRQLTLLKVALKLERCSNRKSVKIVFMSMLQRWRPMLVVCSALVAASVSLGAQTDLDAFMKQVLATRDENWKKLQQYVLDERETIDMQGPGHTQLWGERKDYTWYVRDGFFVRSPVKVNGVTISESERRKYETDYLQRQQRRERRRQTNAAGANAEANAPQAGTPQAPVAQAPAPEAPPAGDVESLLKQTREPEFISSAYFLRFRFEEGKYALVGRETLDGIETLRIEYYPTNLFRGTDRRRNDRETKSDDKAYDAEFRRLMNKTALVTLWVEPKAHQIVKYTFDNIALDFLPAQWLVQLDELHASMTMGQPFPAVWLPSGLEFHFGATFAIGPVDLRYTLQYHDYRRADVTTKVTVPKDR